MKKAAITLVWDNFGPIHNDRCAALANALPDRESVLGIELHSKSDTYSWKSTDGPLLYKKITLNRTNEQPNRDPALVTVVKLCRTVLKMSTGSIFFCHYERPSILLSAIILRIFGRKVFIMNDSKYDDYPRILWREVIKSFFYLPYQGAIASVGRSADYLRFLGFHNRPIEDHYNARNIARIRAMCGQYPILEHDQRYIIIIARLVEKKNIATALHAYALYRKCSQNPRALKICGDGPLESELRTLAKDLDIDAHVEWLGFLQEEELLKQLHGALCLLLMSKEEQFGNVFIEAAALGIPCIASLNVGARETIIKSAITGFIVEYDNSEGAAYFLEILSSNKQKWDQMSAASYSIAQEADTIRFVNAVIKLTAK